MITSKFNTSIPSDPDNINVILPTNINTNIPSDPTNVNVNIPWVDPWMDDILSSHSYQLMYPKLCVLNMSLFVRKLRVGCVLCLELNMHCCKRKLCSKWFYQSMLLYHFLVWLGVLDIVRMAIMISFNRAAFSEILRSHVPNWFSPNVSIRFT